MRRVVKKVQTVKAINCAEVEPNSNSQGFFKSECDLEVLYVSAL